MSFHRLTRRHSFVIERRIEGIVSEARGANGAVSSDKDQGVYRPCLYCAARKTVSCNPRGKNLSNFSIFQILQLPTFLNRNATELRSVSNFENRFTPERHASKPAPRNCAAVSL